MIEHYLKKQLCKFSNSNVRLAHEIPRNHYKAIYSGLAPCAKNQQKKRSPGKRIRIDRAICCRKPRIDDLVVRNDHKHGNNAKQFNIGASYRFIRGITPSICQIIVNLFCHFTLLPYFLHPRTILQILSTSSNARSAYMGNVSTRSARYAATGVFSAPAVGRS